MRKVRKGAILYNANNYGFVERMSDIAYKLRLFKIDSYQIFYEIDSEEVVCYIARIHGIGFVVSMLQKLSEYRSKGPDGKKEVTCGELRWFDLRL